MFYRAFHGGTGAHGTASLVKQVQAAFLFGWLWEPDRGPIGGRIGENGHLVRSAEVGRNNRGESRSAAFVHLPEPVVVESRHWRRVEELVAVRLGGSAVAGHFPNGRKTGLAQGPLYLEITVVVFGGCLPKEPHLPGFLSGIERYQFYGQHRAGHRDVQYAENLRARTVHHGELKGKRGGGPHGDGLAKRKSGGAVAIVEIGIVDSPAEAVAKISMGAPSRNIAARVRACATGGATGDTATATAQFIGPYDGGAAIKLVPEVNKVERRIGAAIALVWDGGAFAGRTNVTGSLDIAFRLQVDGYQDLFVTAHVNGAGGPHRFVLWVVANEGGPIAGNAAVAWGITVPDDAFRSDTRSAHIVKGFREQGLGAEQVVAAKQQQD